MSGEKNKEALPEENRESEKIRTVTIELSEPVEMPSAKSGEPPKVYTSLTFRRRKAKDLVAMDLVKGETRKAMAMYASMAGVPLPVIEELDGEDYDKVALETVPLMGKSAEREVGRLIKRMQNQEGREASEE